MKMHFAAALGLACSIAGITPALAQKTTLIVGLASADAGVLVATTPEEFGVFYAEDIESKARLVKAIGK